MVSSCDMSFGEYYVLPEDLQGTMSLWQADVYFLKHVLPEQHENLFHTIDESDYMSRADELFEECEDADDDVCMVGIRKLVASVGDAHTSYHTAMDSAFPLNLVCLDDGVFVTAAREENGDLVRNDDGPVGAELTAINGIPLFSDGESIFKMMCEIVSHENEYHVREQLSYLLLDPKILHGLGIIESRNAETTMSFRFPDSTEKDIVLSAIPTSTFKDQEWRIYYSGEIVDSDHPADRSALPDYQGHSKATYWSRYDEETHILHILYNRCAQAPDLSFSAFVDETFGLVAGKELRAVLIDLRNNSGGDSRIIRPLYDKLEDLTDEVALYTAIGPATFSSALMNALSLNKKFEGVKLIGRPTGGKPNHYGEVDHTQLPSGAYIYWSTNYFVNDRGNDYLTLEPEIPVGLTSEEFFDLADPVLTEIIDRME